MMVTTPNFFDADSEEHERDARNDSPERTENRQEYGHKADRNGHTAAQHEIEHSEKANVDEVFCL